MGPAYLFLALEHAQSGGTISCLQHRDFPQLAQNGNQLPAAWIVVNYQHGVARGH